jgi:methyl-accepting chemotaxis protein
MAFESFDNIKIRTRLLMAFFGITTLMVLLGGTCLYRLSIVNEATADIATNWLPAIRALGDTRAALNAERRAEALVAVATTDEVMANEMKSLAKAKDDVAQAWKTYQATIDSDEERALAKSVDEKAAAYQILQARVLDLAHAGSHAEATTLYQGDARQAFRALVDAVNKSTEFQVKGSDSAYGASQSSYRQTQVAVLAGLVMASVASLVVGLLIARALTAPLEQAVVFAEAVAAGDLTPRSFRARKDEIGKLLAALVQMNSGLAKIVGDVRKSADSIATGSSQIASGNADLSQRTEEQASNLQQTAASMEELTVTVKNNADAAQQARQLSESAREAADAGGLVVGKVVDTMEQIAHSSRKISDIIGVIDGIAFQTNILALNAAVEAARAGEQGRGFAVVAGEVRSLAQRSSEAAREIKSLIGASVTNVEQGSQLAGDAGQAIGAIVEQVKRVNDLVGEISAASLEQTSGIGQVGDAVTQLDQVTQQNAALVEESAAAAESLQQQAQHMTRAVAVFRLG